VYLNIAMHTQVPWNWTILLNQTQNSDSRLEYKIRRDPRSTGMSHVDMPRQKIIDI